ncbi:GIY-YIG nuclease family protein [Akkermansiaceae bacterium]|nr:GIY-YIG nuclease family protein [Akkermansiaceae bacterium]MDB4406838.1 GIY-YIG nuclease family protein [Akkermansiaceae bacterium]MDB4626921.1 GIY-YIG nuclease family protein [Akkermansiaceae bacterium]
MSKNKFTEKDEALLGELGVDVEAKKVAKYSKEEERIIAGFEEIQRFVEEHDRVPQHGEDRDIFERLYAARLDRLVEHTSCSDLLQAMDHQGILEPKKKGDVDPVVESLDDDELLAALGVEAEPNPIEELKYVRTSKEIRAAEEVAQREPCLDFEQYKPLFEQVQADLKAGARQSIPCKDKSAIEVGDLFIVSGQNAYVANESEKFRDQNGKTDRRLRVIFSNGTESKMLFRSFQKRLWEDVTARRIVTPSDVGALFSNELVDEDKASGVIYILRSLSEEPFIKEHQELIHKIGFTKGSIERRIADAENQPTYLLAGVEVVKTYSLYNVDANKLENLFHRFFATAKLDIELKDRFGKPYKPREWFLVPLEVIQDAVNRLMDGTLVDFFYNSEKAMLEDIN